MKRSGIRTPRTNEKSVGKDTQKRLTAFFPLRVYCHIAVGFYSVQVHQRDKYSEFNSNVKAM